MALRQLYIAQSLDGYIADEEGGVGWLEAAGGGEDYGYDAFFRGVGALAMGASTYEQVVGWGVWPYADVPTWVFTHRELSAPPDADVRFTDRRPSEVVGEMDEVAAGNVWLVGGADLVRQWVDERVLDELSLFIVPLLLGGGVRLFGDTVRTEVELVEAKTYGTGFVELRYRFRRNGP
ncbi:MAG: dihydrofolate reductase family protein [Actinomycetota bacterium]|nr:dihydrofolate reductase family protein [Actinomycetota bacterium]